MEAVEAISEIGLGISSIYRHARMIKIPKSS